MNCRSVRKRLTEYIDGELDAQSAQEIALHIDRCASCRAEVDILRRIEATLASLASPETVPDLTSDLYRQLAMPTMRTSRLPYLAGATIVLACLALLFWMYFARQPAVLVKTSKPQKHMIVRAAPQPEQQIVKKTLPVQQERANQIQSAVMPESSRRHSTRRIVARRIQPEEKPSEEDSFVIVIVTRIAPSDLPPVSSYQATVSLPDGTASSLEQVVTRHDDGTLKIIDIAYEHTPAPVTNRN